MNDIQQNPVTPEPIQTQTTTPIPEHTEMKKSAFPWLLIALLALVAIILIGVNGSEIKDKQEELELQQPAAATYSTSNDATFDESSSIRSDLESTEIEGTSEAL